ncbi:MAG: ribonuclease III [Bacteroidota bacterium]|nr:ribonuclease III [Bacteroidota bacterium]MDX5429549.1 ribonuclease III [Bacteroidota bacterium]MDX5468336.1 ribonuclease III [Bacteroidota bacterium]
MKSAILKRLFGSKKTTKNPKLKNLKHLLGFTPGNYALYEQAFRHNSFVNQHFPEEEGVLSNERLEYLGDAVLDCVVAEVLFLTYPNRGEGFLTETRAKIVSRAMLGELAVKMGLDEMIQYGRGLGGNKQVIRSLSGNALEALLGAIYLDKGYKFTRQYIMKRVLKNYLDIHELAQVELNFKSRLIEWSQKVKKEVAFELVEEKQKGRAKIYVMRVTVNGEEKGRGEEFSKKKAEQEAARKACIALEILAS